MPYLTGLEPRGEDLRFNMGRIRPNAGDARTFGGPWTNPIDIANPDAGVMAMARQQAAMLASMPDRVLIGLLDDPRSGFSPEIIRHELERRQGERGNNLAAIAGAPVSAPMPPGIRERLQARVAAMAAPPGGDAPYVPTSPSEPPEGGPAFPMRPPGMPVPLMAPPPMAAPPIGASGQPTPMPPQSAGGYSAGGMGIGVPMRPPEMPLSPALQSIAEGTMAAESVSARMKPMIDQIIGDTRNDAWSAIAKMGFATAAGNSPYALQNLGQGMVVGLDEYNRSKERGLRNRISATYLGLAAEDRDVARADRAEARGLQRERLDFEKGKASEDLELRRQSGERQSEYYKALTEQMRANGFKEGVDEDGNLVWFNPSTGEIRRPPEALRKAFRPGQDDTRQLMHQADVAAQKVANQTVPMDVYGKPKDPAQWQRVYEEAKRKYIESVRGAGPAASAAAPAAAAQVATGAPAPLPVTNGKVDPTKLVAGQVYNTPKGLGRWNGRSFDEVQ